MTSKNSLYGPLDPGADAGWDEQPRKGFFTDTSICIGCKACEVACKEWNAVPEDGLLMLGWLLERETVDGHLSPTPVGGAGIGDPVHGFDQQPIEVAAMADACSRAAAVTGDNAWLRGVDLAARWFRGENDRAAPMWDPATGGGYDGLEPSGPNLNQGAESTLALVSTLQHAHRLNLAAS